MKYFNTLKENGYAIDVAGISFYPSAPYIYINSMILFKRVVTSIYKKCGLPAFIANYVYPSGTMSGPYAGWNKICASYPHTEAGQRRITREVIRWGRIHGVIGLRYWIPDFEHWGSMNIFSFRDKTGTSKEILL